MTITIHEYIAKEKAIWGVEHVEDLIERGYIPKLLIDGTDEKWYWVYEGLTPRETGSEIYVHADVG